MALASFQSKVLTRLDVALLVAFAIVVALFIASTFASQSVERSIESASQQITANASPDVRFLSAAQSELSQHQVALDDYLDAFEDGARADPISEQRTWEAIEADLQQYMKSAVFPGETELWQGLSQNIVRLGNLRESALGLARAGRWQDAIGVEKQQLDPLTGIIRAQLDQLISVNASQSAILAAQISDEHRRAHAAALALNVTCGLLSLGVAVLLLHFSRASRRELETRTQELEAKTAELTEFSGRMAHDVVSPLLAANLGWDLARKLHPDDARLVQIADVSRSAIHQSQRLVNDLLAFALAGARPTPGAESELSAVLASVVGSLRSEADAAHVAIESSVAAPALVACASGVLTSILSNLVRNAIKHMGSSPVREVRISATADERVVRVKVTDSGPGVPTELQHSIFEPYVRGPTHAAGIGLGLATVKRLVEAHGGRVGLDSSLGAGATFWFELPRAQPRRLILVGADEGVA
jgi:signal transduction histidine kinase